MFYLTLWRNMQILANYVLYTVVTIVLNMIGIEIKGMITQIVSQSTGSKEEPALEITADIFHRNSSFKEVLHNFSSTKFVQDKCDINMVAYAAISGIYANKIIISIDGFKRSSTKLTLFVGEGSTEKLYLTDMEFINGYFIAVINDQLYTYDLHNNFTTKYNATGIPSGYRATRLSAFKCCQTLIHWCNIWRSTVIVYTHRTSTSHFYVSFDTAQTFNQVNLNTDVGKNLTTHYWIYNAAVMSTDLVTLFLVKEVSKPTEMVLLGVKVNPNDIYHETDTSWVKPFYEKLHWLSANIQQAAIDSIGMGYLESNYDSLIIWDHHVLLYKSRFSDKPRQLQVYLPSANTATLSNTSYLRNNEVIRDFQSSISGEFILVTSQNRVIYGQESTKPQVIILSNLEARINHDTVIRFIGRNTIEIIYREGSDQTMENSILYSSTLDLSIRLNKYTDLLPACPYRGLIADDIDDFYEVDISDTLTFRFTFYPEAWSLLTLLVELSVPNSLYLNSHASNFPHPEQFAQSYAIETVIEVSIPQNLILEHGQEERYETTEKPRVTALRMVAPKTSITCSTHPQIVTHIGMGCSSERHIKPTREYRICDTLRNGHNYVIEKEDYTNNFGLGPTPTADKEVSYDFNMYGCPLRTYYSRPFTFDLHLYQGTDYVGPVTGSYVVHEVFGVNKLVYNKKISDLNCTYPPQSWTEMAMLAQSQNITNASSFWHRGNFLDCNEKSDLRKNVTRLYEPAGDEFYEVLGTKTNNSITFERNGLFIFEIIVIDHRFSFCDLRTFMAVEVYGFQPHVPIPFFVVMGSCIFLLITIILACYAMKQNRVRKAQRLIQQMDQVDEVENLFRDVAGFYLVEDAPSRTDSINRIPPELRRRLTGIKFDT